MKKLGKGKITALCPTVGYYGLAFVIALAVGMIMYAAEGQHPFGDRTVLCMDLWGQYFPMYEQNASTDSLSELLYSWNGALGYNNWAQSAYYCNSLFLWILPFLSSGAMVAAINWFCLLKISFSALTCLIFLTYKLKRRSPFLIGGAVAYSLCSYMMAFLSQPMWTDALIYAPLVLMGLEKLIREKKPLFYMVTLALTMISSFYIGFALCIFLAVYYVCSCLTQLRLTRSEENKLRVEGGRECGMNFLRFAGFSVLAAAVSAFVLIPVAMAIGNIIASEIAAPEKLEWYANITAYFQSMLPERRIYLEYQNANIATGTLVFLLVPLYFFNRKIRTAEKIGSGVMLVFLFASMNANVLDYLWHGFHFPNQLPGRWTFLFSLYVILLACSSVARLRGLTPVRTLMGLIVGFTWVYITCQGMGEQPETEIPALYWLLLIAAAVLLLVISVIVSGRTRDLCRMIRKGESLEKMRKYTKKMRIAAFCCGVLFAGVQIFDIGHSFVQVALMDPGGLSGSELPGYMETVEKVDSSGSRWKCGDDEFYRVEMNYGFTFNPSMMGDYHGMGYYSSTMNGDVYRMMRYLGNRVYAENVSTVYNTASVVQDSLFGIRYYIDSLYGLNQTRPDLTLAEQGSPHYIWENPTALSVAYAVSSSALNWEVTDEIRGIQNQNALLNSLCGEELNVYQQMVTTEFYYENATLQESDYWEENFFFRESADAPVKFFYTYTCQESGTVMLEHNFRAGTIRVSSSKGERDVSVGSEKFCSLGAYEAGEVISITVEINDVDIGCCGLNLYRLNPELWQTAYERLASQQLQVESFENTSLEGTITMEQEGLVLATIPQDGGWEVYCDGEKAEIQLVGNTLIAVNVPAGTHTLRYEYTVPGLGLGILISVMGLAAAVWFGCPKVRGLVLKRKKQNPEPEEAGQEQTATAEETDSQESVSYEET